MSSATPASLEKRWRTVAISRRLSGSAAPKSPVFFASLRSPTIRPVLIVHLIPSGVGEFAIVDYHLGKIELAVR